MESKSENVVPAQTESAQADSVQRMVRQKLWRVNLKSGGMQRYNPCYVVAPDASAAYQTVRTELDRIKYGFTKERELQSVELVAEDYEYTEVGSRLFLPNAKLRDAGESGVEQH